MQLGITEAVPPREAQPRKAFNFSILESWNSFEKAVGLCFFGPLPRSFIPIDDVLSAVHWASGWDVDIPELLRIGERATNLAKLFNVREGFSRRDDTLPERLFQPLEGGMLSGVAISRDDFATAMTALYEFKGWDPVTTAPTRARLADLGIEWAAELAGV